MKIRLNRRIFNPDFYEEFMPMDGYFTALSFEIVCRFDIIRGSRDNDNSGRQMILRELRRSLIVLVILSILTGVLARLFFPEAAGGSLIARDGKIVGSRLIGQAFTSPGYFWGRPSAAGASGYDASASSGSNDGPLSPALLDRVKNRLEELHSADPGNNRPVPVDLVTTSGSGLDPHISVAAALYQVPRVARSRGMAEQEVRGLVDLHTEGRQFGFLGEPRVNVLGLNLALDLVVRSGGSGQ
jgi:K+-transporting ATPase ATPase C chain